jgi:hypothetical protein
LFLSKIQVNNSGDYYFDVFDRDPNPDTNQDDADLAEVQFAITYGHINGGGAPRIQDDQQAKLPTKVIYSQYKNLLLQPGDVNFIFNEVPSEHIYVINVQRARVREQLDPGNWELPLSGGNGVFTFIDNSETTLGALARNSQAGRIFEIVSGSILDGPYIGTDEDPAPTGLGFVYPDLGIIVLNPDKICPLVGFWASGTDINTPDEDNYGSSLTNSSSIYTLAEIPLLNGESVVPYAPLTASIQESDWNDERSAYNHAGLYVSLRQALQLGDEEFQARSAETISSTHYFVRLRNRDFNYSNNPTFSNVEDGTLTQPEFREDPTVFVTSIGMYNDNNELLAVAKLSKPVRKSFAEEILMRVRLDF